MTYSIACGDVVPGCEAQFIDDTKDGLLSQTVAHAGSVHGITEVTPEVAAAVAGAIKTS